MSDLQISVLPKEDAGEIRTIFRESDIRYSERMFTRDSVEGGVTLLGEFTIMAKTLGPVVIGSIGGWVAARQGRRVRIKMGDIEAEASSVKEVEELLTLIDKRNAESTQNKE